MVRFEGTHLNIDYPLRPDSVTVTRKIKYVYGKMVKRAQ